MEKLNKSERWVVITFLVFLLAGILLVVVGAVEEAQEYNKRTGASVTFWDVLMLDNQKKVVSK